jgi:hypothetical protein
MHRVVVLGALAALAGCSSTGRYALEWELQGSEMADAYACARHGIDGIQVQAVATDTGEPTDLAVFPCAAGRGGRSLPAGGYQLYVSPVDARGARLLDPRTGQPLAPQVLEITVSDGAEVTVSATIPVPPAT